MSASCYEIHHAYSRRLVQSKPRANSAKHFLSAQFLRVNVWTSLVSEHDGAAFASTRRYEQSAECRNDARDQGQAQMQILAFRVVRDRTNAMSAR